ncbi:MAG: potassium channel family protein, partial [Planctomycetia bacterium]
MANYQRRFVVLGLGTFGSSLARRLSDNGCRVTGVDSSEKAVVELQDKLYEAVVADVTDRDALERLLLNNAESVFISLGENIERSIMAALHVKELGARQIFAKGVTEVHARILRRLGVERVIFPEAEIAVQVADGVTWPNVLDKLKIDPNYSVVEIATPTCLSGKSLQEADLRRVYGVLVVAIKDALRNTVELAPTGDFVLSDDHEL